MLRVSDMNRTPSTMFITLSRMWLNSSLDAQILIHRLQLRPSLEMTPAEIVTLISLKKN